MIRVLYDGWPLVFQPNSPAALHLLALFKARHSHVTLVVAAPAALPEWLPASVETHLIPGQDTQRGWLQWEQSILPHLAAELQADLLHLTHSHPPLFGKVPVLVSPGDYPIPEQRRGFLSRLHEAVSSGGMARLRGLIWPEDLPAPGISTPIYHLPAEPMPDEEDATPRSLLLAEQLDLPETYVLASCAPAEPYMRRLLDSWSWAAGAIGEQYPLCIFGLDGASQEAFTILLREHSFGESVIVLPRLHPGTVPALVQGSAAVFHPGPLPPWGSIARLALAYGKPLAASASPLADALAGPAAYLAPETNPRLLGAALISVILEEKLAQRLAQIGRERAARWDSSQFSELIFEAYRAVIA
jgi:glycosyltransferase involved in cell wall biosynthesis